MPIYEFRCRECGGMSEFRVSSYSASQALVCSSCGSRNLEQTDIGSKFVKSWGQRTGYYLLRPGGTM